MGMAHFEADMEAIMNEAKARVDDKLTRFS